MFLREAKGARKVLHVRICRVEANVLSTPNDHYAAFGPERA